MSALERFSFSQRGSRLTLLAALFLHGAILLSAHSEEAQDLEALLAEAKSEEPAKRLAAYETLRQAGPGARTRLAALLDSRLRSTLLNLVRLLALPAVKAEAVKRTAALEALRQTALTLIFDEAKYPDSSHGGPGQAEADAALEKVEAAWGARPGLILAATPGLAEAAAQATELSAALANLARQQTGGLPQCFEVDAILERVCVPEQLAAWPVLGGNAFAPSPERPCERSLLAQVNAYRLRMGLPMLRFDERLYRAAAGFAQESHEKNIKGHISETPGKRDPIERAAAQGQQKCVGETVGYNGTHFEDWLRSASHHRVLADKQSTEGAVAIYEHVAVFMTAQADPPKKLSPAAGATALQKQGWENMARATWNNSRIKGLERLARYLTGIAQLKPAAEVWMEVLRRAPEHAEARTGIGDVFENGQWTGTAERSRAANAVWQAKLKAWRPILESGSEAARLTALQEIAEAGARELSSAVLALLAEPGEQAPKLLRMALITSARMGLPGIQEKAIALLKSENPLLRAAGAEALEYAGSAAGMDALIAALETRLTDYPLLQAIQVLSSHRNRMDFTDDQAKREERVKALKAWWEQARKEY